jgi:integrase
MGAERHANLKIDVSAPTLAVLLDEYEAARRTSDISDVHLSNHMTGVRECVKDCGWVFPSQVTAPAVVGHLERRKALGNGPRRRNHVRAYILHFADWLAARGLVDKINPKAIPRARVPRRRARYCPTRDEVVRLILAASQDWRKGDRWLVYLVAATTGLRTSTLRKLTPAMFRRGDGVAWLEIPGSSLKSGVAARVWLTREVSTFL